MTKNCLMFVVFFGFFAAAPSLACSRTELNLGGVKLWMPREAEINVGSSLVTSSIDVYSNNDFATIRFIQKTEKIMEDLSKLETSFFRSYCGVDVVEMHLGVEVADGGEDFHFYFISGKIYGQGVLGEEVDRELFFSDLFSRCEERDTR